MQNKTLYTLLFVSCVSLTHAAAAQEAIASVETQQQDVAPVLDMTAIDVSDKKMVDFPARTSLDTLEMATLPGINETNITGPQPLTDSVSPNDMPSEKLLGKLNPDVFEEMAELERDNAFLKLQIQKEQMKNDLENLRASYRQNRLDEIAKREDVVRTRIQWWQEQEKLRLEAEKQRQEAAELKEQREEAEALKAQLEAAQNAVREAEELAKAQEGLLPVVEEKEVELAPIEKHASYTLVGVKGTRGNLVARVKDAATEKIHSVRLGEELQGEVVTAITPDSVILARDDAEYVITFAAE